MVNKINVNNLTGEASIKCIKVSFKNTIDMWNVKNELEQQVRANQNITNQQLAANNVMTSIMAIRETHRSYRIRAATDNNLKIGYWYNVASEGDNIVEISRQDNELENNTIDLIIFA